MRAVRRRPLSIALGLLLFGAACDDSSGSDPELEEDGSAAEPGEDSGSSSSADAGSSSPTTDAEIPRLDAAVSALDASTLDSGRIDSGTQDAGRPDAGANDAGRDAAINDSSVSPDAGGDAGTSGRSVGCGKAATSNGSFEQRTIRVGDVDRVYHLRLPDNYSAARAYSLIFRWHGHTGDGLSGGLDIEGPAGRDAIIVGANGIDAAWTSESEANDLLLFDGMYDTLTQRYCVDLNRVFSYGFSMGGGMTNLLGCRRSDKLRATAAIAGFDRGTGTCARPVAAWFLHDENDDAVLFSQGTAARDRIRARNHCSTNTVPAGDCVRYEGCDAGFPLVWCATRGRGHNIAGDTAPGQAWEFFRTLP